MLYLAIDQHAKQLTVSLRDEEGNVLLRRQVSTQPKKVEEFFQGLQQQSLPLGGFVAILEVCGFNDWLINLLQRYLCRDIVLIQPEKTSKKKTDRRDANQLGELLWVNRQRLLAGRKIQGVRRIVLVPHEDLADRRLTAARHRVGQQRTRVINQIKHILRRHNLQWEFPTKTFDTKRGLCWLGKVGLPPLDRVEMNQLLARWALNTQQMMELEGYIARRFEHHPAARLLATIPGVNFFMALALACRINSIARFPRPRSLANYWGLTPGCRNSGAQTDRLGSITKQGSKIARFLLGQLVLNILRKDAQMRVWYTRLRRRRGSKIARVAVMRRMTSVIWHMLHEQRPYRLAGVAESQRLAKDVFQGMQGAQRSPRPSLNATGGTAVSDASTDTQGQLPAASPGGLAPQTPQGLSPDGQKRSSQGTRRPNSRPRSPSLPNLGQRSGCSPAEPDPPPR
jgi:transposase